MNQFQPGTFQGWGTSDPQNQLFASGWDFSKWTGIDWAVAIVGGFAVYTAGRALWLSAGRLR